LPKKSNTFRITSAYIEFLHDSGIAVFWPDIEPVGPGHCLDLNLLESASWQPFQAGFGQEFYPTVYDKAACLFFSLAGGHVFGNGNKRTSVLATDLFLHANSIYLNLSNEEIRRIAIATASYRERGEEQQDVKAKPAKIFESHSFPFKMIRLSTPKSYRNLHWMKRVIQNHPLNTKDAKPQQH